MKMLSRLIVFVIALVVGVGAYYYVRHSRDAWELPSVVTIETEDQVASVFPEYMAWLSDAEPGQPQALLLRDGDFFFGSDAMVPYESSDGLALKPHFTDWSAALGETTVSVDMGNDDGLAWFKKASDLQLAGLRFVGLPDEIDADTLVVLKRLAVAKPNVGLGVDSDAVLTQVLPLFQPRAVFAGEGSHLKSLGLLANQPQLETLLVVATEPGSLDYLPMLPKLRRLVIAEWDVLKAGPLPAGLTSLKSLVVLQADGLKDLSALLGAPDDLEELSLLGTKELADISGLARMTGLRTLALWGNEGLGDLSGLAAHKTLRWVGVPPNTTQEQVATFVSAHPDLAILDLMGNDQVTDLAPLGALKRLHGLILDGPYENLGVVQSLTSLRFVGISKKTMEAAPDQVAAIRKALPDAVVVRVRPLCLGSGWILLMVPVMIGTRWLRDLRRRERSIA